MAERLSFFVVEDDALLAQLMCDLLEAAGHDASFSTDSGTALGDIINRQPDCVILDIMMPGVDGFELCHRLKENPRTRECRVVVVSAKAYEADRSRALEAGAIGFIRKPIEPEGFAETVMRLVQDRMELTFWGVRGTLPVPGERALRYGGNTNCVSLSFAQGALFVFDAGTGIKALARHLLDAGRRRLKASLFISHSHWDHINAFPFFDHLYIPGNELHIYGPPQGRSSIRDIVTSQMDGVYFPITMSEFAARVSFTDLYEGIQEIDGIAVRTMLLNHPGNCLGYRIDYGGRSVCYITDIELYPADNDLYSEQVTGRLVEFMRDATAVIIDSTYRDSEYPSHVGWGHSSVSEVADAVHRAGVETLYLYHHDPGQDDGDIDAKLAETRAALTLRDSAVRVVAPCEGDSFSI